MTTLPPTFSTSTYVAPTPSIQRLPIKARQYQACVRQVLATTWLPPAYEACTVLPTFVPCDEAVPPSLCPPSREVPQQPSPNPQPQPPPNHDAGGDGNQGDGNGSQTGLIIGITLGGAALLLILFLLIWSSYGGCYRRFTYVITRRPHKRELTPGAKSRRSSSWGPKDGGGAGGDAGGNPDGDGPNDQDTVNPHRVRPSPGPPYWNNTRPGRGLHHGIPRPPDLPYLTSGLGRRNSRRQRYPPQGPYTSPQGQTALFENKYPPPRFEDLDLSRLPEGWQEAIHQQEARRPSEDVRNEAASASVSDANPDAERPPLRETDPIITNNATHGSVRSAPVRRQSSRRASRNGDGGTGVGRAASEGGLRRFGMGRGERERERERERPVSRGPSLAYRRPVVESGSEGSPREGGRWANGPERGSGEGGGGQGGGG